MYIVEGKVVSKHIFEERFVCDLTACKGACCWEGDFGAPVTDEEADIIDEIKDEILPLLDKQSVDVINQQGTAPYLPYIKSKATPLHKDGACAYLIRDSDGIAQCSFEQAFNLGRTSFRKPISCHLYPIRVSKNKLTRFEAINYDKWEICSAACTKGKKLDMPVFRFVKPALIRAYGKEFYDHLEDLYTTYFGSDKKKKG